MRGAALLVLLGVWAPACSRTTELLTAPPSACVAPGPPIYLGGTDAASCAGALAARFGRYALCSCGDLTLTGSLRVGPGSPLRMQDPGELGPDAPAPESFLASVGTDRNLSVALLTEVGGSLVTAGPGLASLGHGGHVQGDLRGAGGFTTMTTTGVWVSGEMASGGDVSGKFIVVGGPLHAPPDASITEDVEAADLVREAVSVARPCGCGATPAVDIAAAVAERETKNANATLSFSADLLTDVETPQSLDLPCGEFYVPELRTGDTAPVELRVHGRVGLFVAGDARLGNNFSVTLDAGAELDLIVAGSFSMTGRVFGSPSSPARTRLWVGSTSVQLPDQIQFGAAVYAPSAALSAGAGLTFAGSLFVGTLTVAGDVRIAYDTRVVEGGATCGAAPPPPVE
jgi:hypothetical protein